MESINKEAGTRSPSRSPRGMPSKETSQALTVNRSPSRSSGGTPRLKSSNLQQNDRSPSRSPRGSPTGMRSISIQPGTRTPPRSPARSPRLDSSSLEPGTRSPSRSPRGTPRPRGILKTFTQNGPQVTEEQRSALSQKKQDILKKLETSGSVDDKIKLAVFIGKNFNSKRRVSTAEPDRTSSPPSRDNSPRKLKFKPGRSSTRFCPGADEVIKYANTKNQHLFIKNCRLL
jgi:hypothetical protein